MDISATIWRDGTPDKLTEEQEALKRQLYESMNPRRRKFIDRIGYENWAPFQKPNDPIEMRQDVTGHTTQQLVQMFMHTLHGEPVSNEYSQGVIDSALGIVNRDEKTLGRYAFCAWYDELLVKEGRKLPQREMPTFGIPQMKINLKPTPSAD